MTVDLEHHVMDQDYKRELLDILYARSFKFDPDKGFTLTSGAAIWAILGISLRPIGVRQVTT